MSTVIRNASLMRGHSSQPYLVMRSTADWTKDVVDSLGDSGLQSVRALVNTLPRKIKERFSLWKFTGEVSTEEERCLTWKRTLSTRI